MSVPPRKACCGRTPKSQSHQRAPDPMICSVYLSSMAEQREKNDSIHLDRQGRLVRYFVACIVRNRASGRQKRPCACGLGVAKSSASISSFTRRIHLTWLPRPPQISHRVATTLPNYAVPSTVIYHSIESCETCSVRSDHPAHRS